MAVMMCPCISITHRCHLTDQATQKILNNFYIHFSETKLLRLSNKILKSLKFQCYYLENYFF